MKFDARKAMVTTPSVNHVETLSIAMTIRILYGLEYKPKASLGAVVCCGLMRCSMKEDVGSAWAAME